jgi:hypothetical protein
MIMVLSWVSNNGSGEASSCDSSGDFINIDHDQRSMRSRMIVRGVKEEIK